MSSIFQTRASAPPDPATLRPDTTPGSLHDARIANSQLGAITNFIGDFSYPADPDWQLNDERFDALTQGISPQYWPQFGYARSEDHAQEIRARMQTYQWADQRRGQAGSWAIPGDIAYAFIDPPQLAAMLATGGVGTLGNIAIKGERLAAALRAGYIGAGINIGMTAIEASQKPTVTANDVMRSGLMGFGFGVAGPMTAGQSRTARFLKGGAMSATPTLVYDAAGRITGLSDTDARDMQATALQNFLMGGFFNSLARTQKITEVDNAFQKAAMIRDRAADEFTERLAVSMYKKMQFRDIADQARAQGKTPAEMLSPKGLEVFSDELAALQENRTGVTVPDDAFLIQPGDPVPAQATGSAPVPATDGVGLAMGAASSNDPAFLAFRPQFDTAKGKRPGDLFVGQYQSDAMPRFNKWARLGLSEAGFAPEGTEFAPIREAYNTLIYDALPKQDGSMGGEVATWSYAQRTAGRAENIRTEIDTHAKHAEWAKANGQKPLDIEAFGNKVTEYRRSRGTMHADDPGVVEAHSRLFAKFYPDELGRQQRHGVPNAENVAIDPWHTPRMWHDHKVDLERYRAGHEGIRAGIAKNLTGDIPQSRRLAIAEALLRRQLNRFLGTPASRGGILDGDAADLEFAIREVDPNISDADLRDIIYYKAEAAPDGTPKYLRRRIGLDENGTMDLMDLRTREKYTIKVSDLLYNNAFELGRRYVEHSVGNSSLAEVFRAMARQDEKPAKDIGQFIDRIKTRLGRDGVPIDQYQKHLDRIETALKRIGGLPVRKTGDIDLVLKAVGDVEFARTMSNITSGIQNVQQVGEALASQTLDVAMASIPEIANIREVMKRTDGKLDNRFLREAAALGIAEAGMARRPRMFLPDDSLGQVTKARKAAFWTSRAAKAASMVSGQDASAKLNSVAAAVVYKNTWADMAFGGRALDSGQNLQRLKDSGLTPEMGSRIKAMIEKYAVTETANGGTKIRSFETADWVDDPEAASAFNIRMARFVERVTGEGNPTNDPLWMSNSFLKLFTQLRNYTARQWSGKTLYAADQLRQGNIGAMSRVAVSTTAWAAALYMARVYVQSIGRDDREDYLDKMLDHKKVALGAIGRNDTVSLMPWFVDVAALGSGAPEPVFAFARASEMRDSGNRFQQVFGSPTSAHLEAIYGSTSALGGSLFWDDYVFSREDLNNVSNGLAVPNVLNLKTWAQRELSRHYSLPAKSRPFNPAPQ
jgi:hypothetical protein